MMPDDPRAVDRELGRLLGYPVGPCPELSTVYFAEGVGWREIPRFATDPAAMLAPIDELFRRDMVLWRLFGSSHHFSAEIRCMRRGGKHRAEANTAPEAIALAALAALRAAE